MNHEALIAAAAAAGFATFWILGARHEKGQPKLGANLVLYRASGRCFHVHHWMVFAALAAVAVAARAANARTMAVAAGFALGAALEDLRYPDWDVSNEACPHN